MKGAFVCSAAPELCSLFIRLFYQDGKTPRGLWLGCRPGGGWMWRFGGLSEGKKKSHRCRLAALSHTGVKLKAKDGSRLKVGGKKSPHRRSKPAICPGVPALGVEFPQIVCEKLCDAKCRREIGFGRGLEQSHAGATFCSFRLFSPLLASRCCHRVEWPLLSLHHGHCERQECSISFAL